MAVYQVQSDGNAPKGVKTGDHVVTAGGTYQVLDSSQYQGMSADQLASAGVSFNPKSGLYSKKISDVSNYTGSAQTTVPQLSLRTGDTARKWADTQNQKVSADLDSAYYTNRQNAYNTYADSMTNYNQQANNVRQAYLDNISGLYDQTYQNNNAALERAASRGLTSSGLGQAMQVSALASAAKQNADYRAQRNTDLNNIEAQMVNLTNQYNVNLDTLVKKLQSDKISALSQNEIAYLQAVMDIEEANTSAYNNALTTQQQQAYEAEQAMLQREYQASQAQLDREQEMALLMAQINAGSFSGGYSYGGRGGYSRRGYGGYGGYSYGSGSSSLPESGNSTASAGSLSAGLANAGAGKMDLATANLLDRLNYLQNTTPITAVQSVVANNKANMEKTKQQREKAETASKKSNTSTYRYNASTSTTNKTTSTTKRSIDKSATGRRNATTTTQTKKKGSVKRTSK